MLPQVRHHDERDYQFHPDRRTQASIAETPITDTEGPWLGCLTISEPNNRHYPEVSSDTQGARMIFLFPVGIPFITFNSFVPLHCAPWRLVKNNHLSKMLIIAFGVAFPSQSYVCSSHSLHYYIQCYNTPTHFYSYMHIVSFRLPLRSSIEFLCLSPGLVY